VENWIFLVLLFLWWVFSGITRNIAKAKKEAEAKAKGEKIKKKPPKVLPQVVEEALGVEEEIEEEEELSKRILFPWEEHLKLQEENQRLKEKLAQAEKNHQRLLKKLEQLEKKPKVKVFPVTPPKFALKFNLRDFRRGVIMKEILARPRALRMWRGVVILLLLFQGAISADELHQGFGLAAGAISGLGLSYIRNISEKITIQINGAIIGTLKEKSENSKNWVGYNLGGNLKWNFHRRERTVFYGIVSGGVWGNQDGITSVNIGVGIGLSLGITRHGWCSLDIENAYFIMRGSFFFPMPQIAIHYWF
jgi:hypothetical protein